MRFFRWASTLALSSAVATLFLQPATAMADTLENALANLLQSSDRVAAAQANLRANTELASPDRTTSRKPSLVEMPAMNIPTANRCAMTAKIISVPIAKVPRSPSPRISGMDHDARLCSMWHI
jgi:hypothetical protein